MKILFVNPVNWIIEAKTDVTVNGQSAPGILPIKYSYFGGMPCMTVTYSTSDAPQQILNLYSETSVFPERYFLFNTSFTSKSFTSSLSAPLIVRPHVSLSIYSGSFSMTGYGAGLVAAPGTSFTIVANYSDPAEVGWFSNTAVMNGSCTLKIKDRSGFCSITNLTPSSTDVKYASLTSPTMSATWVVSSNYPGLSNVRIKDTTYLLKFEPVSIMWSQTVPSGSVYANYIVDNTKVNQILSGTLV